MINFFSSFKLRPSPRLGEGLGVRYWQKMGLQKGQSLVEILLAMGLAAVLLPALLTGLVATREGKVQQNQRLGASALLVETEEAIRSVREKGWDNVVPTGTYHPILSGSSWSLAAGTDSPGGFTRSLIIADVLRDTSGNIVTSGGSPDPSTRQVTTSVSWDTPTTSSVTSAFYLTRYLDNLTHVETLQSEFDTGTKTGTSTSTSSGGEVLLGAGGYGNWCEPNLNLSSLDLPKSGVANAISAIEGRAFAGTGDNASGVSFANVQITNTDPPTASVLGTYDGFKTNGIFGESDYAYLATDNNTKEVEIVNLTTNPYSEAGSFNTTILGFPVNADATAVYVSGNRGYVTAGSWLYVFDLSSKFGSRPPVGFPHLLVGTGTSIVVSGNYAFVSVSGSPIEMQIIDVSNPWSIFQAGYADVNGQDGKHVFINSTATRAYLVTNASASLPEFFIIDTSSKSGSRPTISSYDANGMNPKDLAVVTGNKAIIVGSGAEEYQVLDITTESLPSRCGGLNLDTGVNGIASVLESDGDAFSYIITGDASSELKIIEGGPGGRYSTSGTFESATFPDVGYSTAFNYMSYTATVPANTTLQLQVAGADQVSSSCPSSGYVFVGPDGTSSTFFSVAGEPIPLNDDGSGYENPARCFRYKAYLTTIDTFATPVLYDVTVNYSP